MVIALELILLAGVIFFIALPLINRGLALTGSTEYTESELSDLLYKKEASYIALKDLEFDYNTGKIDDTDYLSMKSQFESEAMEALKMIENYKKGASEDRSSKGSINTNENQQVKVKCPGCGVLVMADHKFCHHCGSGL